MSDTLRILLVEDNAGDARLMREMFVREGAGSFELTHLLRLSEAVAHLAKGGVDVMLLDLELPDAHGLDTVRRVRAVAPGVPVIVLTGLDGEALAANSSVAEISGQILGLLADELKSRPTPDAVWKDSRGPLR